MSQEYSKSENCPPTDASKKKSPLKLLDDQKVDRVLSSYVYVSFILAAMYCFECLDVSLLKAMGAVSASFIAYAVGPGLFQKVFQWTIILVTGTFLFGFLFLPIIAPIYLYFFAGLPVLTVIIESIMAFALVRNFQRFYWYRFKGTANKSGLELLDALLTKFLYYTTPAVLLYFAHTAGVPDMAILPGFMVSLFSLLFWRDVFDSRKRTA